MRPVEHDGSSQERREALIRRLAVVQYGLFSHAQAIAAGFTRHAIAHRVATGVWNRVLPSVFELAGAPSSGRQVALAACLWAGEDAVVSHEAAGVFWRLDGIDTTRIHVTVPRSQRLASSLVDVHRGRVDAVDRTRLEHLPITTPARTLIDCAPSLDDEDLEAAVEDGLKRGLFTERFLRWRLEGLTARGRAGIPRLRRIHDARRDEPALERRLEVKVWRLLHRSGLPRAVRQHRVTVGGRPYRLDFAWPDRRVAVEADGRIVHGGRRRPFYDDRRRLADLVSTNWRVVPVTWEDVEQRPTEWLTKLAQTLALAA
jgi:very-short-patch-repair endonuclease